MVSVPWRTTKPSYPSYRSSIMDTSVFQLAGSMSEESISGSKVYESILYANFLNSGTSASIWLKSNGLNACMEGSSFIPIVPPV